MLTRLGALDNCLLLVIAGPDECYFYSVKQAWLTCPVSFSFRFVD